MTDLKNSVIGSEKKPYVKPEFEVFNLDNQAPLLVGSPSSKGAGFNSIDRDIDE